jgi:predicted nucleic acid-binding protein
MKRRIYTDTSVFGGYYDEEFQEPSRRLFERFEQGLDLLVLSDLTRLELRAAPERVRRLVDSLPVEYVESVELGEEARRLADLYIASRVVPGSMLADAQHIATATVHRADVVVSWNFKHIVNLRRIHGFNSVNLREEYPLLEIRTPREVVPYEPEETERLRRGEDDAGDPGRPEPEADEHEP